MQPAQLSLEKVPESGGGLVVKLKGKLVLETVSNFINTLRNDPAERLVLDMSQVSFIDSAGVGALASLFVTRRKFQKTFALAGLTPQATAMLEVVGLVRLLPSFPTVEAAVEAKN